MATARGGGRFFTGDNVTWHQAVQLHCHAIIEDWMIPSAAWHYSELNDPFCWTNCSRHSQCFLQFPKLPRGSRSHLIHGCLVQKSVKNCGRNRSTTDLWTDTHTHGQKPKWLDSLSNAFDRQQESTRKGILIGPDVFVQYIHATNNQHTDRHTNHATCDICSRRHCRRSKIKWSIQMSWCEQM